MVLSHYDALDDFHRARRRAQIRTVLASLRGKPYQLFSFDEVRRKLGAVQYGPRELRDIPLDAIIGSVNRYTDFTRDFLPRASVDPNRWAHVKQAILNEMQGLDPIEVYQIGNSYFVSDGNHRVSIARQMGQKNIQAYVVELKSSARLSPDTSPESLILEAEYAEFLSKTHLTSIRPDADLRVTVPGGILSFAEHIATHHYYMGSERHREVPFPEAVSHWYDNVYLPVVRVIRQKGLVYDFPGKTEADLYLWLTEYRSNLENETGSVIQPEQAAKHLAFYQSSRPQRLISRLQAHLINLVTPDILEIGPPPGEWRREKEASDQQNLFTNILVPVNGQENGWNALEQALVVAHHEGSHLQGLHVIPSHVDPDKPPTASIRGQFEKRCLETGIQGKLNFIKGNVAQVISHQAAWSDLVVVNLSYPTSPKPLVKLRSRFRTLVQRCPRPILVVPQRVSHLRSALLAYDGSPKAQEALYVAVYLAGKWQIPLNVLAICDERTVNSQAITQAQSYLEEHGIQTNIIQEPGPIAPSILLVAEEKESDFIIMGGYGDPPLVNFLLESVVDQVLLRSRKSMLLCR
jgi:nucleotide-binding universal stress UspA family protein